MAETAGLAADEVSANVAVAETTAALARHWLSIHEEESLFDVRVPRMPGVPSAVSLPVGRETAMHGGNRELVLNIEDSEIAPFVRVFGNSKLVYGYPVLTYPDGALRPMFALRASVDGNRLKLENHAPRLNRGLLQEMGVGPNDILELLEQIKDTSFEQALEQVCQILHCDSKRFACDALEPGFESGDGHMTWFNRPVLAAATMSSSTAATIRELADLASDMRSDVADRSALAAFEEPLRETTDGALEPLDGPMVFDIHNLGASQIQFARAGMTQRLTIASALPGTGQMAAIVNLIATAVMQGQSVLYSAKRPETAAAMAKHLDGWIGRGSHVVIRVGRKKTLRQAYKHIRATLKTLQTEDDASKDVTPSKLRREKPTLKALRELDNAPSNTGILLQTIRESTLRVHKLTTQERKTALKLDAGWCGPSGRKAPTPTPAMLRDWRARLSAYGEGGDGIGGKLKAMFSKNGGRDGLLAEIRTFLGRMPAPLKAAAIEAIGERQSNQGIESALKMLDEFGSWKVLVEKRKEAIRELVRLRDGRTIELQAMNQAARKISGVRELFRDSMRERLLEDVGTLEKQVATFFELVGERDFGQDESHRAHRSQRLAQAQQILAKTLPVWVGSPAEIGQSLPLEPGVFDLVIVDEAEQIDLGSILPLLYRAQRAVVVGAPRRRDRASGLKDEEVEAPEKTKIPAWATSPKLSAMGALIDWLTDDGSVPLELTDHFRSHPVIADYLSSVFYKHRMMVRSNYRKLREGIGEQYLGLHWHEVDIHFSAEDVSASIGSELDTAEALLKQWDEDGFFELAPRRTVGVVSPHASQVEELSGRLRRNSELSAGLLERATIALPDAFAGRQVDVLLVLPGVATTDDDDLAPVDPDNETLYHDAIGAARLGVHVVGAREAVREIGGHAAALAGACSYDGPLDLDDPSYDDDFERRMDSAFSVKSGDDTDPMPILKGVLNQLGLPYQENILVEDQALLLRVLAPLGGRYDIEISKPISEIRSERELLREIERDEKVLEMGYIVVRLTPDEIIAKSDFLVERLQRLV